MYIEIMIFLLGFILQSTYLLMSYDLWALAWLEPQCFIYSAMVTHFTLNQETENYYDLDTALLNIAIFTVLNHFSNIWINCSVPPFVQTEARFKVKVSYTVSD